MQMCNIYIRNSRKLRYDSITYSFNTGDIVFYKFTKAKCNNRCFKRVEIFPLNFSTVPLYHKAVGPLQIDPKLSGNTLHCVLAVSRYNEVYIF